MEPRGREVYSRYQSIIGVVQRVVNYLPHRIRLRLVRFHIGSDSLPARLVRFVALRSTTKACGDLVDIRSNTYVFAPESLSIGSRVSIHPLCYIDAAGGVTIGSDVSIAHNCTILSTTHTWAQKHVAIRDQPLESRPTAIGSNVWFGAGVRVMPGVQIGDNVIVGAGSVVTHDVPAGHIVAGVPARPIKRLYREQLSTDLHNADS